jgi:hypothetical protein
MEKIMFYNYNAEQNIISTHSIDFKLVIPFLEHQDFCIVSVCDRDGEEIKDHTKGWIRNNHSIYIKDLVDLDEEIKIHHIHILLNNSGFISFDVGQLRVKLSNNYNLSKTKSIELLKSNGIYCADKCWEIVRNHNVSMPVYFLIGVNPSEYNSISLKMIKKAYRIDCFHKHSDTQKRYVIEWPNGIIKETGFEENNQKIGDCDYFNENGMKHKTESWMLDSEGQSFIYSSINYIN